MNPIMAPRAPKGENGNGTLRNLVFVIVGVGAAAITGGTAYILHHINEDLKSSTIEISRMRDEIRMIRETQIRRTEQLDQHAAKLSEIITEQRNIKRILQGGRAQ